MKFANIYALLALLHAAPARSSQKCLEQWRDFQVEGCTYGSVVGGLNNLLPDNCLHDGATELQLMLPAGTNLKNAVTQMCSDGWDQVFRVNFTDVDNRFDDTFMDQFVAGDTFLNTETGSLQNTVEGTNIDIFRDDEAENYVVNGFPKLSQCHHNSIMCCFGRDRQPGDGNGNCELPLDVNCTDADPADNTNLCFINDDDITTYLGQSEGDVHCHGFAWSKDENDFTSRLKYNNFFYVSLYDHLYKRGYVENMVDSNAAPMCGCIEDMSPVSRADCTQIDAGLTFTIKYDGISTVEAIPKENDLDVNFNACQGTDPRTGENQNNDLASYVYRLYLEGKITEEKKDFIYKTLVGYAEPDENHNEEACAREYSLETMEKSYCSDEECVFFAVDTQLSSAEVDTFYGDARTISVDRWSGGKSQALIKFDNLNIPQDATVVSAELAIHTEGSTQGGIHGYRMIQGWTDESTWSSFGDYGVNTDDIDARSIRSFYQAVLASNEYAYFDVSQDVSYWLNHSEKNQGWVLNNDSSDGWYFGSAETGRGPSLTIKFSTAPVGSTPAPVAPTPVPIAPAPCTGAEATFNVAVDTDIRSTQSNKFSGNSVSISVDKNNFDDEKQGLLKFPGLVSTLAGATVISAKLTLKTINSSIGPIRAYRMIKSWTTDDESTTWNFFDGNGVSLNDIDAKSTESFASLSRLSRSKNNGVKDFDVTNDVIAWLQDGEENQGWVFTNDSSDGWDFEAYESETTTGPVLTVTYSC